MFFSFLWITRRWVSLFFLFIKVLAQTGQKGSPRKTSCWRIQSTLLKKTRLDMLERPSSGLSFSINFTTLYTSDFFIFGDQWRMRMNLLNLFKDDSMSTLSSSDWLLLLFLSTKSTFACIDEAEEMLEFGSVWVNSYLKSKIVRKSCSLKFMSHPSVNNSANQ